MVHWGWQGEIDGGVRRGSARFYGLTFRRLFVGVWKVDRTRLRRSA